MLNVTNRGRSVRSRRWSTLYGYVRLDSRSVLAGNFGQVTDARAVMPVASKRGEQGHYAFGCLSGGQPVAASSGALADFVSMRARE